MKGMVAMTGCIINGNNMKSARLAVQWLAYMAVYICIHGLTLFRFGMDWDEVNCFGHPANVEYLLNGRWGLYGYLVPMGGGTLPLMGGLVGGFFMAAALMVQTRLFGLRRFWQQMVYGAMYMACLQWVFQLRCSVQSDGVALGFLLLSAGALLLTKPGRERRGNNSTPKSSTRCPADQRTTVSA